MHGVPGPAIGKTIARISAFRQIFAQCGLGRPDLLITHSRAPGGSGKDVTFRLASADARGYRSALGSALAMSIASFVKRQRGGGGERERPEIPKRAPRTQDRRRAENPSGAGSR